GHGIPTERVAADDDAPNIIGCVEAGAGGRHVVFNAHMDTMEAGDEAAWTVPIMRLSRRNGRLYGLGMGNMKGALAAMCLATTILNRHSNAWRGRLTMTAVSVRSWSESADPSSRCSSRRIWPAVFLS